jgi:hypothetical protein
VHRINRKNVNVEAGNNENEDDEDMDAKPERSNNKFMDKAGLRCYSVDTNNPHPHYFCYSIRASKVVDIDSLLQVSQLLKRHIHDLHSAYLFYEIGKTWFMPLGFTTPHGRDEQHANFGSLHL